MPSVYARDLGEPVDLAVCIGSSHAFGGGYELGLRSLAGLVGIGGQVLLGEGFWRRTPDPAYLEALGDATEDEFADYGGLVRAGIDVGLTPLYAVVAERARLGPLRVDARHERRALRRPRGAGLGARRPRSLSCRPAAATRSASGCSSSAGTDDLYGPDLALIHDTGFGDFARAAAPGVLRRLPPGGFVVELGCGSGILTESLVAAGHEVVAVDVSEAMLTLAERRVPEARFELASLHDMLLPPCDAIVAVGEVVSYGEHPLARTFARWAEALRPGGVALFDAATTAREARSSWRSGDGWTIAMEASLEGRLLTRRIETSRRIQGGGWRRDAEVHVLRLYSDDELLALLSEAGLAARVVDGGYGGGELPPGIVVFEAKAAPGDG